MAAASADLSVKLSLPNGIAPIAPASVQLGLGRSRPWNPARKLWSGSRTTEQVALNRWPSRSGSHRRSLRIPVRSTRTTWRAPFSGSTRVRRCSSSGTAIQFQRSSRRSVQRRPREFARRYSINSSSSPFRRLGRRESSKPGTARRRLRTPAVPTATIADLTKLAECRAHAQETAGFPRQSTDGGTPPCSAQPPSNMLVRNAIHLDLDCRCACHVICRRNGRFTPTGATVTGVRTRQWSARL